MVVVTAIDGAASYELTTTIGPPGDSWISAVDQSGQATRSTTLAVPEQALVTVELAPDALGAQGDDDGAAQLRLALVDADGDTVASTGARASWRSTNGSWMPVTTASRSPHARVPRWSRS